MVIRTEIRLLLLLSRREFSDSHDQEIASILRGRIDWELFSQLARSWGVFPLVSTNLVRYLVGGALDDIHTEFSDRSRDARGLTLSRVLLAGEVIEHLHRAGIEALVIKGPSLGATAYGDLSLRPFDDLDLVVKPAALKHAKSVLEGCGFEGAASPRAEAWILRWGHAVEFFDGRLKVELHTQLLSKYLSWRVPQSLIWKDCPAVELPGVATHTLSPDLHFLYLCAHAGKHDWPQFRVLLDLSLLARSMSHDQLANMIRLSRVSRSRQLLVVGAHATERLLGGSPIRDICSQLETSHAASRQIDRVVSKFATFTPHSNTVDWALDRMGNKTRSLLQWVRQREAVQDKIASPVLAAFEAIDKRLTIH